MLSIVVPAFNEEQMVEKTAETIAQILNKAEIFSHEIVFVDDGSKDDTWKKVCELSKSATSNVVGIRFSRNFGKEAAVMAGLAQAKGDCCVVIDCDLQHPPEKIVEMYKLWLEGYEVIEGRKSSRGEESVMHAFAAKLFYNLISSATGIDMSTASDFKLLDRKAVDALINMREKNAFFRALSCWIGFKTTSVHFDVQERTVGESRWSTKSLFRYALNNISSFSNAPMQIVTVLGLIMLMVSFALGITALVQKFSGQALEGFTTVILILLFSGSIIMISLGIIGYYIARIYEEIKDRPRYIITEMCGS